MLPLRFNCWVCPGEGRKCNQRIFQKPNYKDCEAARKELGNWVYSTEKECNKECTGSKLLPIYKVCWACEGQRGTRGCYPVLQKPGTKCKAPQQYPTKQACKKACFFHPLNPPIQPLMPPLQPLNPPLVPVTPPGDKIFLYVVITAIVLIAIALIVGSLFFFA